MLNQVRKKIVSILIAASSIIIFAAYGSSEIVHEIILSSKTSGPTYLPVATQSWVNREINSIRSQATNLDPSVLKLSLIAYQNAQNRKITNNPYLTIVDYSKPSTERRLWVINLKDQKVLFNTWVAHGKNSGGVYADSFSNAPESLKSCIGVFLTQDIYSGKHGESLRVQGLEPGTNNNAFNREIVFHGAEYVSDETIAKTGKLGRSWGCWAVEPTIVKPLIQTIKNKGLVIAYYPDKNWLKNSSFLT